MATFHLFLIVFLAQLARIYADTVVHDASFEPDAVLHITAANKKQPGVPVKEILLVNGLNPGPELKFTSNQTVWIRVYNDIHNQNLTMHWHGLTLAAAPFSDGTPLASQWPIPPNKYYDYNLRVPLGYEGTYFYHSHFGLQAIEEPDQPPYRYDEDRVLFFQDVYQGTEEDLVHNISQTPPGYEGDPEVVLLNGKTGGTSEWKNVTKVFNETLPVINVRPGRTYRLRFIGATAVSFISVAFEDHPVLTVIEADGHYTEKYDTSFMQIHAGQRFSALLKTKDKPTKQRYIIQYETRERDPEFTKVRAYAILNYGASPRQPIYQPPAPVLTLPPTDTAFLDYKLRPLRSPYYTLKDFPTAKEVTRRINITTYLNQEGHAMYQQNGVSWFENSVDEPYLVSLYKNNGQNFPSYERALANSGLDPIAKAYPFKLGEVVEIVVQNTGTRRGSVETHPWHAHGAHYWDLGGGDGYYNQTENELKWKNSVGRPILRDTTLIYKYGGTTQPNTVTGWRAWRIRVTQPGVWMAHCHILIHMALGMNTVWVMGNSTEILSRVPYKDIAGYLDYGGSVMGNVTNPPEVVDFFADWTTSN